MDWSCQKPDEQRPDLELLEGGLLPSNSTNIFHSSLVKYDTLFLRDSAAMSKAWWDKIFEIIWHSSFSKPLINHHPAANIAKAPIKRIFEHKAEEPMHQAQVPGGQPYQAIDERGANKRNTRGTSRPSTNGSAKETIQPSQG